MQPINMMDARPSFYRESYFRWLMWMSRNCQVAANYGDQPYYRTMALTATLMLDLGASDLADG